MANSFRILGGKSAGRAFRDSELFDNPLAGLVTGILVTVLVQSSSTSTSIIITMTAGDLIEVKNAIPMIMGANIGTSVTNTLVSLGSFANKAEYRRAFAGATVHDCFNLLTVLVFLPIEAITHVLQAIASEICDGMDITDDEEKGAKTDFLKKLTKPVSTHLLGIDKKLITAIAKESDEATLKKYQETSIIKHKQKDDNHIFLDTPMGDGIAGVLMVFVSLLFLCICLMMLVKLLQTIFRGRIAIWFRTALNLEFESLPGVANYVLILFGIGITILFQSSSVTTSTLTPLCGIGLVRIDKMFAFTIGANIGTTFTGILSALVSDKRKTALTVAFSHTLFNLIGTLVWYPVPLMRSVPIGMAKMLGNIAADLPWFPIFYIIFTFGALPALLLGLSVISPWLCLFVGVPFVIFLLLLVLLIGLRANKPHLLPPALKRDPYWLINSLRVEKLSEEDEASSGRPQSPSAASADLGKGNWKAAPAAWGISWFVVLALLMVVFNAKWADMKYTSWDKRNHYGISGWGACSYAFEKSMAWAPAINEAGCTSTVLNDCGKDLLDGGCSNSGFSTTDGSNSKYEDSWVGCRKLCTTTQWKAWCDAQNCKGDKHFLQCLNVTAAVQKPYTVSYMPAGNAWEEGKLCRNVEFLCAGVEGDVKSAADLSVVGLVFAGFGLASVLAHAIRQNYQGVLFASLAFWAIAWMFLLASWAVFAGSLSKTAVCKVEAESGQGAVIATGKFGDIINNSGSYTFGYVIGAWLLSTVPIILIVLRINELRKPKQGEAEPKQGEAEPSTKEVVSQPEIDTI
jgi:sodium-dependent phosphate cotransporter